MKFAIEKGSDALYIYIYTQMGSHIQKLMVGKGDIHRDSMGII